MTAPFEVRKQRAINRWQEKRGLSASEAKARFTLMDNLQHIEENIATNADGLPLFTINNTDLSEAKNALPRILEKLFPDQQ